jgi:hypothetical protein
MLKWDTVLAIFVASSRQSVSQAPGRSGLERGLIGWQSPSALLRMAERSSVQEGAASALLEQ